MLDINVGVMLIESGIFLVTLFLLNQWLFKPLLTHMEEREAKLESQKAAVSNNADETKKYEEEIAKILETAKFEANQIKKVATNEANEKAISMVESELKRIEEAKKAFSKQLEEEENNLKAVLEKESADLKEVLSSKIKGIA